MHKSDRTILAAVGIAIFGLGWFLTFATERQINVHSGKLRNRHTAYGIQIYTSNPRSNAWARAAQSDRLESDWLTVSLRSMNRHPCREEYGILISGVANLCEASGNQEEAREFARSVLAELNETRSVSRTLRHVMRVREISFTEPTSPSLIEAWKTTEQDPAYPPPRHSGQSF